MACPSNQEENRPKNFVEAISSDHTWVTFGMRIKWTDPVVPGNLKIVVNEPLVLRLCVETKKEFNISPQSLSACCWTHIRNQDNPCGIWREIKLLINQNCTQTDQFGNTTHVFHSSVVPTSNDLYRLTFNVKHDKLMIWANYFQVDNMLDVQMTGGTQQELKTNAAAWKSAVSNIWPRHFPFYCTYFSSLFSDKKGQSTSKQERAQSARQRRPDADEEEILIKL